MQLPPGLTLSVEDAPSRADAEALSGEIEAFNEAAWPRHQPWQELGLFLRGKDGVAGGLFGETYAGWLFIRYLWLSAPLRHQRLGTGLLRLAERRAVERGCHAAHVDSFSFQAPEFYRRQGYEEFGRLPYPPRGERVFLRKRLDQPPPLGT